MSRKVVTRAPHREVGVVNAGWLLNHPVEHESHLERRFVMVALSCPVATHLTSRSRFAMTLRSSSKSNRRSLPASTPSACA
jgi:hypothetical protein